MQDVGKQLYIQRGAPSLRQARLSLQASLTSPSKSKFFLPVRGIHGYKYTIPQSWLC